MLEEAIRVQLDNDYNKGKKYVEDYFIWTNEMQEIAEKKKNVSNPMIMATIKTELADKFLGN